MSIVIKLNELNKSFGNHIVLNDVSLLIDKSTAYGLVGLNGAGKTTLLRLMLGILKPDSGAIIVNGFDPWSHNVDFYTRLGVVLEHDGFWGNLTIKENLKIFSAAKMLKWHETEKYINEFWSETVITSSDKKVKHLSRGQRVQCSLCRAFLGWPDVLLLDEPAVALDMTAYAHFRSMVNNAKKRGAAVIISSHQLDTIDDLCDRVGNLSSGILADLQCGMNGHMQWLLFTSMMCDCLPLLSECGCTDIIGSNGKWSFLVNNPQTTIPAVVEKMVSCQYPVYEIRPETTGFSDTIRSIYTKQY
jgi:ABC-type multidrug transport system ATPase subunit